MLRDEISMKRKRLFYTLVTVLTAVFLLAGCAVKNFKTTEPEAVEYTPVETEVWELDSGLKVIFYQDQELPLVKGALYVRGGSLWEPEDLPGVMGALGSQMRLAGAGSLGPDKLDLELEKLAASVGTSFGGELGTFTFSGLSEDFESIFSLFSDVVLNPRLQEERLLIWKKKRLEGIKRRKDSPGGVAGITFKNALFGDSPYGRVIDSAHINKISREDLLRAHRRYVRPDDAILTVTGNISKDRLKKVLDKYFSSWQARGRSLPEAPAFEGQKRKGIFFVKGPFKQATVIIGQTGPARLPDDYKEIIVFNEIFGGGDFSSRLMKEIRVKRGLAYSTFGGILPGKTVGRSLIHIQTKSDSVADVIRESLNILTEMQAKKVTLEEVSQVKRNETNSFVFRYDSPGKQVGRQAMLELLEYPQDYDLTYLSEIAEVSTEDVQSIAQKYWNPEQFVVVVVGDENAYNSLVSLEKSPAAELLTSPADDFSVKVIEFTEKPLFQY